MTTNQLHGPPASSSASSAALRGASLAFQNSNKSRGLTAPSTDSHERALAAATISAQTTGGSTTTGLPDIDQQQARAILNSRLQQQTQYLSPKNGGKDASFIAATLAASRSASPSPRVRRSPSVNTIGSHLGSPTAAEHVDAASIPPTGNLIRMFEGGSPRRRRHGGSVDEGIIARRRSTPSPKRIQRLPRDSSKENLEEEGDNKHEKAPDVPPQQSARPKTPHPKPVIMQQKPTPERITTSKKQDKPSPASRAHTPGPTPKPLAESQPQTTKDHTARNRVEKPTPKPKPVDAQKRPSKHPKSSAAADSKPPRTPAAKPSPESTSYNMAELRSPVLGQSTPEIQSPAPRRLNKLPLPPPTPPQHSRTISRPSPQLLSPGDPEKRDSPRAKKSQPQPPTPPKPRGSTRVVNRAGSLKNGLGRIKTSELDLARTSETDSPQDVFVSAPTSPTYSSPPPQRLPSPTARDVGRNTPSPTRWSQRPPQQPSRNNLDFDSLTSAIMAGSLASSRLTPSNTGSTMPPILPQRTRSPRLRTTMRNTAAHSSDSEDDRHKKSRRPKLRSGKHAHHEGARKKWRDQIRQRERKRYEAVWASNRGYHLPTTSSGTSSIRSGTREGTSAAVSPVDYAEYIANVVVRDIWRRSRLPEDELVEVWELVDRKKRGMLDRSEFVVGMWLIDQRLRGRKIPQKVSDSVWASAHGMLRVKTPKRH